LKLAAYQTPIHYFACSGNFTEITKGTGLKTTNFSNQYATTSFSKLYQAGLRF